jgi:hypothetical protein
LAGDNLIARLLGNLSRLPCHLVGINPSGCCDKKTAYMIRLNNTKWHRTSSVEIITSKAVPQFGRLCKSIGSELLNAEVVIDSKLQRLRSNQSSQNASQNEVFGWSGTGEALFTQKPN